MSRLYLCDQCEDTDTDPMTFALRQICDETDDNGDTVTLYLHLCSATCLANYAMSLTLDFPDDQGAP